MIRTIALTTALALSAPAFAGEAEITLKLAADMATALADTDPGGGWVAVEAGPEPLARGKATIEPETFENTTDPLVVSYDPGLTRTTPYGATSDGAFTIYAVDVIEVAPGAEDGTLDVLPSREAATIETRGLTWADVASDHLGYLLVATDGSATLVFPPMDTELAGIEPDEID